MDIKNITTEEVEQDLNKLQDAMEVIREIAGNWSPTLKLNQLLSHMNTLQQENESLRKKFEDRAAYTEFCIELAKNGVKSTKLPTFSDFCGR